MTHFGGLFTAGKTSAQARSGGPAGQRGEGKALAKACGKGGWEMRHAHQGRAFPLVGRDDFAPHTSSPNHQTHPNQSVWIRRKSVAAQAGSLEGRIAREGVGGQKNRPPKQHFGEVLALVQLVRLLACRGLGPSCVPFSPSARFLAGGCLWQSIPLGCTIA